ncbi:BlaI/MecI/CopY family transcriptional regulator [Streptomyces sp. VNUA74]|uniref:BlaI/MecI/CopY family transcriptional regulator n=1 Tax=Streptomyces sp. VNUA74 TaxID=3062685 RepID=UPI00280B071C|nr:BlaI/MecI/CopY family transcriptional regulator [Streptomyces sp. VNUA74]WML84131.1 BlaI/MecI/CopY family transcriptional regulator [Streptomyces sp. VNUA74]
MSESTTQSATQLASQYSVQVTDDLERNVKEQERVSAELTALQQQLAALQHDHALLVNVQQALGITAPEHPAAAATVPAPRESAPTAPAAPASRGRSRAKKAAPAPKRAAAPKPAAKQAAKSPATKGTAKPAARPAAKQTGKPATKQAGKATTKAATKPAAKPAAKKAAKKAPAQAAAQPTLVELVRTHLVEANEPRSAAEVTTALGKAHAERNVKTTVVRTTLEGLVAKNQAQRSKQGSSVYYTATGAAEAQGKQETADAEPAAQSGS